MLAVCIVWDTDRDWTAVTRSEACVYADTLIINTFRKLSILIGIVGVKWFSPVLARRVLCPSVNTRAFEKIIDTWVDNLCDTHEVEFVERYNAIEHKRFFPNTFIQPQEGSCILLNHMFPNFIQMITFNPSFEPALVTKLYQRAMQRFGTDLSTRGPYSTAEFYRDIGDGSKDSQEDECTDAIFGGRAVLEPDGTITHDTTTLDPEKKKRVMKALAGALGSIMEKGTHTHTHTRNTH
jgi:hypothetical protein